MTLCFKHKLHDNDFIDLLISTWTKSKYIHTQILFSDGIVGGAWMETGVAFRPKEEVLEFPEYFTLVNMQNTEVNEQIVYEFIEKEIGKEFDMKGAIISTAIPSIRALRDKWHCTEIVYAALVAGGMPICEFPPEAVTPQRLFDHLTKRYKLIKADV